MAKTSQQYLDAHDGNAEEALKAAVADVGKRENQNTSARAFKRAYAPLIEALQLPADVDTESEGEAQQLAARALESLAAEPEGDDSPALALLDTVLEALGLDPDDLHDALGKLPEDVTPEAFQEALHGVIAPVLEPLEQAEGLRRERDLGLAAASLGKPADALAEILDGKPLEARKVKAQDGTEADVWGIPGDGDAFRPLSELKAVQYLTAPTGAPEPRPAPRVPVQETQGGRAEPKSAEARAQELRGQITI